jgi:hypothetical protein
MSHLQEGERREGTLRAADGAGGERERGRMTKPLDDDIKTMRAVDRAFRDVPRDARLRTLAYFVSRELDVGTCPESETLYAAAQVARARILGMVVENESEERK